MLMILEKSKSYVGRFAPSPTGDLHFGSWLTALASYLDARKNGGLWLLRIEDLDPPREVPGSAASIIQDLGNWGLRSDLAALYQSQRINAYESVCEQLIQQELAYWCGCSRNELPESGVYPGTCSAGLPTGRRPRALRVRTIEGLIEFEDRVQGKVQYDLKKQSGDFVIRRADGYFAYQLAVVVDDAHQQVTDIVRGADLLDSTPRQIWLQRCLGLPAPEYAHIPLVTQMDGQKLSKRLQSDPLRNLDPLHTLRLSLKLLGQEPPELEWNETWSWALANWSLSKIPRLAAQSLEISA